MTSSGERLAPGPAASYERTNTAFIARFGKRLINTYGYRSLAQQWDLFRIYGYPRAAIPGTSHHGLGLAMDLGAGVNVYGSPEWVWMNTSGRAFGWVPLNEGNLKFEPWHWAYLGHDQHHNVVHIPTTTTTTPPVTHTQSLEDSMAIIYDAPGLGLWLDTGAGPLVGVPSTALADAMTSSGAAVRPKVTQEFLAKILAARAGVELIWSATYGEAVGTPGQRYRQLGDPAEVQHYKDMGAARRVVSDETAKNLVA